jgi:predicted membrane protein
MNYMEDLMLAAAALLYIAVVIISALMVNLWFAIGLAVVLLSLVVWECYREWKAYNKDRDDYYR